MNIPLVRSLPKDVRYWWPNTNGVYIVKSGYWLGTLGPRQMEEGTDHNVWHSIWNINGPPKLCHFLWRACNNYLAVNRVLYNRHVRNDCGCSICGYEDETIIHAVFECKATLNIWASSIFLQYLLDAPSSSFCERFVWMAEKLTKDELLVYATLAWAAWTSRNKVLYESNSHDQRIFAAGFTRYVDEYKSYSSMIFGKCGNINSQSANRWYPPPDGVVKLNVDAAVITGSGVRLRVVLRNSSGKILAAEAAAMCCGIQIARFLGYMNLWVESDALGIVQKVRMKPKGLSPIFLILNEIVLSMNSLSFCYCSHVKRVGNTVAHLVARSCPSNAEEFVMLDSFPQSILASTDMDFSE